MVVNQCQIFIIILNILITYLICNDTSLFVSGSQFSLTFRIYISLRLDVQMKFLVASTGVKLILRIEIKLASRHVS